LRNGDAERQAAAGDVAAAQGRLQEALSAFSSYRDESGCVECGLFEQAQLYERLGVADSALTLYERLASVNSPFRSYTVDPSYLAITYRRLGELHEARHNWAKALDYYGRFVDLWKGADAELQPAVRDVRARMARLAAMGDP
jgi:tetratricopeptide (TPR) repeat protein